MPSTGSPYKWPLSFLFFTALVTGAIVMALEILGSRLLAPVFGNSLFVWGALIGVILTVASDLAARELLDSVQLPVGLYTSLIGGPYLIYLIIRSKDAFR